MHVPAYSFFAPSEIVFGWGRKTELGPIVRRLGRRAFLVSGSKTLVQNGVIADLAKLMHTAGTPVVSAGAIEHEPLVSDVDELVGFLRGEGAGVGDVLVAIGGGSAIDLAKAAGAVVTQTPAAPSVHDYLEGVGTGRKIEQPPLPLVAVPTTAGTGTEATKNAVISSLDPLFKKSLRSDQMVPRVALVDPKLTVSVPPHVTAWTGMDAITQLIESYISRNSKPIPRAMALHGVQLALPALPLAFRDGEHAPAREAMAHAALLSGICLANAGLGFAHGVAAALGVHCQVAHGLACATLLPIALRVNHDVSEHDLAMLARATGNGDTADHFIAAIDRLTDELQVPRRLSALGVRAEQIDQLVPASRGNSMNGNPRDVPDAELRQILDEWL